MGDRTQRRDNTPTTSQTTTQNSTDSETRTESPRVLRLRGGHTSSGRSVQWAEDVVDNEGLGRKSSKGACRIRLLLPRDGDVPAGGAVDERLT